MKLDRIASRQVTAFQTAIAWERVRPDGAIEMSAGRRLAWVEATKLELDEVKRIRRKVREWERTHR